MSEYVIISGGEMFNKGAQAMTFITVCEMQKRFPNARCVLLSKLDAVRPSSEKECYEMEILTTPNMKSVVPLFLGMSKFWGNEKIAEYDKYFRNAIAWVDISGYALGSNWGEKRSLAYISNIAIAQKYKIPMYLMPQSFGPFEYKRKYSFLVNNAIKHYLPYCKCIMARELEGKILLEERFHLKNVIKTPDLVLQSHGLNLLNAYRKPPLVKTISVNGGRSMAIIPNMKNLKYGNEEELMNVYHSMIDHILKANMSVYFIYHAIEDLNFAKKIKDTFYVNNQNVCIVDEEWSCIDFEQNIGQFDFVIASRYHSIIHSYKKFVPAIVLGWATKYRELAATFDQSEFCFDVREKIDLERMFKAIDHMIMRCGEESETIAEKMKLIQMDNVYDFIDK